MTANADYGAARLMALDVWQALGLPPEVFFEWIDDTEFVDAWPQLLATIAGDVPLLLADTNPPAHPLLIEAATAHNHPSPNDGSGA